LLLPVLQTYSGSRRIRQIVEGLMQQIGYSMSERNNGLYIRSIFLTHRGPAGSCRALLCPPQGLRSDRSWHAPCSILVPVVAAMRQPCFNESGAVGERSKAFDLQPRPIFSERSGRVVMQKIRVLMADDEAVFCESLSKLLRRKGMEVVTAPNGEEALNLLAGSPVEFDVFLLDLRMPVLDGIATLEKIRKQDAATPVILLTGAPDLQQVSAAMEVGASEVLLKPCPIDMLVSAIENAAERKKVATEVAWSDSGRSLPG
jgi:CheY-like chemotaxis protein